MFHRIFYTVMETDTSKQLYVTYIRPHFEYACQVWDPNLNKEVNALESVQKFALRACTKEWIAPIYMKPC